MILKKLKTVESTHAFAIEMIEAGNSIECAIIAENQTNGIGRCQKSWNSRSGNLFMSVIKNVSECFALNPSKKSEFGQISLTAACAVREAIASYMQDSENLSLHWPNDIHYNNLKISGILLALIDKWVVFSIGINIYSVPNIKHSISMKELADQGIISVKLPSALELSECVLEKLKIWLNRLDYYDFSCIKNYLLSYIKEINCMITIKNGIDSLSGMFRGIDDTGRLILEEDGKRLYISSGDMFLNQERIIAKHD